MSLSTGAGGSILFWMPSRPASNRAAKAMYGFAEGSGQRNSTRLAFGFGPVIGIRMQAERLRCEYTRLTARDRVLKRQLISAWPAVPTSWWARSTFMSRPSMMVTISSRRSPKWSVGATGK